MTVDMRMEMLCRDCGHEAEVFYVMIGAVATLLSIFVQTALNQ